jgi:hypothetical protein
MPKVHETLRERGENLVEKVRLPKVGKRRNFWIINYSHTEIRSGFDASFEFYFDSGDSFIDI